MAVPGRSKALLPASATGPSAPPGADGGVLVGARGGAAPTRWGVGRGGGWSGAGRDGVRGTGDRRSRLSIAKLAGVPVLWGTCPEHVAAPPLWLWEQVLRSVGTCLPEQ